MNDIDDTQAPATASEGKGRPAARTGTAGPVSVIMPVRDAERYLTESVRHVLSQRYPGELELVLAVGPSRDKTEQLAKRIAAADPRINVVINPSGQIPSGLNAAVGAARHGIIVRVDARSRLPAGYIATAVRTLRETGAVNVGGVRAAEGVTAFERAVSWAMTSPFGVGTSRYNTGGLAGPSDSVYLGAFRREAIDGVGGYDEQYLRAEDWEMNHRIRRAGGLIWFQPELRVTYRPRANVRELASQYFLYGRWRRVIAQRHRGTMNLRYLTPVAVVLALLAGTLAGIAGVIGLGINAGGWWPFLLTACFGIPFAYLVGVLVVTARAGTDGRLSRPSLAWLPAVLATMHVCWGAGFLTSTPRRMVRGEKSGEAPGGPVPGSSADPVPGSSAGQAPGSPAEPQPGPAPNPQP
jgi:succinoglycan biosynthesis protein ExoA